MSNEDSLKGELLDSGDLLTYSMRQIGWYRDDKEAVGHGYEQASIIHSALIMLHATNLYLKDSEGFTNRKDAAFVKEDPRKVVEWLKKHHLDFGNLNFAIKADVIFPKADAAEEGSVARYFAEATYGSPNYSRVSSRFFLTDFNPHKNQAVLHLKGRDFNL